MIFALQLPEAKKRTLLMPRGLVIQKSQSRELYSHSACFALLLGVSLCVVCECACVGGGGSVGSTLSLRLF